MLTISLPGEDVLIHVMPPEKFHLFLEGLTNAKIIVNISLATVHHRHIAQPEIQHTLINTHQRGACKRDIS